MTKHLFRHWRLCIIELQSLIEGTQTSTKRSHVSMKSYFPDKREREKSEMQSMKFLKSFLIEEMKAKFEEVKEAINFRKQEQKGSSYR